MDRELIIRLAREAGLIATSRYGSIDEYERFAALVAAHEREACAKVCDEYNDGRHANTADLCAAAIRSRT